MTRREWDWPGSCRTGLTFAALLCNFKIVVKRLRPELQLWYVAGAYQWRTNSRGDVATNAGWIDAAKAAMMTGRSRRPAMRTFSYWKQGPYELTGAKETADYRSIAATAGLPESQPALSVPCGGEGRWDTISLTGRGCDRAEGGGPRTADHSAQHIPADPASSVSRASRS
jgi:hypothetical protein